MNAKEYWPIWKTHALESRWRLLMPGFFRMVEINPNYLGFIQSFAECYYLKRIGRQVRHQEIDAEYF